LNGQDGLGAVHVSTKPGGRIELTANGSSDPDNDALTFRWFVYSEAGTYARDLAIDNASTSAASLTVPSDAAGKTVHVLLEVRDNGTPPLTRYRRAVIEVNQ
jgi:hypothetical protein